jgi:hypothetical protein
MFGKKSGHGITRRYIRRLYSWFCEPTPLLWGLTRFSPSIWFGRTSPYRNSKLFYFGRLAVLLVATSGDGNATQFGS